MAIVGRHIDTVDHYGLPPWALNTPAQYVGYPKVSNTNNVWTTAAQFTSAANLMGYSFAPGTNVDYARNLVVGLKPNTASSGLYSAGTVYLYGKDIFGSTRSESFGVTALNTVSDPVTGSVNFASLDSISFAGLVFHTASSSARSDVTAYVGVGNKIGLPVDLLSSDGVFFQALATVINRTSSGANSTNNQYTVVTGPYQYGGVIVSAVSSASLLQIGYVNLGFRGAVDPRP